MPTAGSFGGGAPLIQLGAAPRMAPAKTAKATDATRGSLQGGALSRTATTATAGGGTAVFKQAVLHQQSSATSTARQLQLLPSSFVTPTTATGAAPARVQRAASGLDSAALKLTSSGLGSMATHGAAPRRFASDQPPVGAAPRNVNGASLGCGMLGGGALSNGPASRSATHVSPLVGAPPLPLGADPTALAHGSAPACDMGGPTPGLAPAWKAPGVAVGGSARTATLPEEPPHEAQRKECILQQTREQVPALTKMKQTLNASKVAFARLTSDALLCAWRPEFEFSLAQLCDEIGELKRGEGLLVDGSADGAPETMEEMEVQLEAIVATADEAADGTMEDGIGDTVVPGSSAAKTPTAAARPIAETGPTNNGIAGGLSSSPTGINDGGSPLSSRSSSHAADEAGEPLDLLDAENESYPLGPLGVTEEFDDFLGDEMRLDELDDANGVGKQAEVALDLSALEP